MYKELCFWDVSWEEKNLTADRMQILLYSRAHLGPPDSHKCQENVAKGGHDKPKEL
jgi:hypothetical protein